MPSIIDLTNQVFGRLTAVKFHGVSAKHRQSIWRCKCKCGKQVLVRASNLKSGQVQSCGCLQKEATHKASVTHGMSGTFEYSCWQNMLNRCRNANVPAYKWYGGRGIKVCKRWLKFENFLADMGKAPSRQHSIEREKVDKGYSHANCRWLLQTEQANNKVKSRRLLFKGESLTARDWGIRLGIKPATIRARLDVFGWTVERSLTTPVRGSAANAVQLRG